MKFIYVYSSLTGNTKGLAEAVHDRLHPESPIYNLQEEVPDSLAEEEAVFLIFYWNRAGTADDLSQEFMKKLHNREVIPMGTLGAYDDGPAAQKMKERVRVLLEQGNNRILSEFCCRGKIELSRTIRRMQLPKEHRHYLDREGILRHLTSHDHPNEEDYCRGIEVARQGINKSLYHQKGIL